MTLKTKKRMQVITHKRERPAFMRSQEFYL